MTSRGRNKLKRHEMEFKSKCIDSKRFVYDIIKYSALKFHVPESCFSPWEGSENDYGCSDFCLVLSRIIIGCQIAQRYKLHTYFNQRHESNGLQSFELVRTLFHDVISKHAKHQQMCVIQKVEISLSIACELVLFLHSKNLNLYLMELAGYWNDSYYCLVKNLFEKAGGLNNLYCKGSLTEYELREDFHDLFILKNCLPYEDSAKNQDLQKLYYYAFDDYNRKSVDHFPMNESEEADVFVRESSSEGGVTEYEIITLPATSERNEASRNEEPQNTVQKIPQHEELSQTDRALTANITLSQNVPVTNPQNHSQHTGVLSAEEKRNSQSDIRTLLEQRLGQLSLDSDHETVQQEKGQSTIDDPATA